MQGIRGTNRLGLLKGKSSFNPVSDENYEYYEIKITFTPFATSEYTFVTTPSDGSQNNTVLKVNDNVPIELKFNLSLTSEDLNTEAKEIKLDYRPGGVITNLYTKTGTTKKLVAQINSYYSFNSNDLSIYATGSAGLDDGEGIVIVGFPAGSLISIPNYRNATVKKL